MFKKKDNLNKNLSTQDYEFMHSLSAAVIQVTPATLRIVLYFWIVAVAMFLVWANFALIDEIARGDGEIIPSGENQMIQNLEGGIVEDILVKKGQSVKKGQILLKINNEKSRSSFSTNAIKADAIEARIIRLSAESSGEKFKVDREIKSRIPIFMANEESLYNINKNQLNSKLNALREQLVQKKQELSEARTKEVHLKSSSELIKKEVRMTSPMVARGVSSRRDFLKLQREANEIEARYSATKKSIPRLKSAIKEGKSYINETKLLYQSEAKIKLNEAVAELRGLRANSTALKDQVSRTIVRSPMKGIVQEMFVHTIGGVIQPGADIIEIVPSDAALLVEVKIKPSDIAFIYSGQKAIVKFSAYDFSIYGGLKGEVVLISADTITDQKDNVFYTVRIKTYKNFIGDISRKLKIIPGMTVSVDIITGQKSVLDYILKPILKTKQYTFTER
ncbi:HlyD family type I secretion periplasmic adaptor subunit [Sulfurimonas sp.]|uniref:HlyD family type I secretion periplasmic adaptor subunit n=1 Tax=Sulfurimonas sp. TaxID=2022749 RepID=UPI002B479641|nr:HlyD family type I secretion periplasmic adaptor subunit [Sulfurimonas sp.]